MGISTTLSTTPSRMKSFWGTEVQNITHFLSTLSQINMRISLNFTNLLISYTESAPKKDSHFGTIIRFL